jgi:hypothetical protein
MSSYDLWIKYRNLYRIKELLVGGAGREKCQLFNSGVVIQSFQVVIYIEEGGYIQKNEFDCRFI